MYKILFIFLMLVMKPVWGNVNQDNRHNLAITLNQYGYNNGLDQKAKEVPSSPKAVVIDLNQFSEYLEQLEKVLKNNKQIEAILQNPDSIKTVIIPRDPLGQLRDWGWYLGQTEKSELLAWRGIVPDFCSSLMPPHKLCHKDKKEEGEHFLKDSVKTVLAPQGMSWETEFWWWYIHQQIHWAMIQKIEPEQEKQKILVLGPGQTEPILIPPRSLSKLADWLWLLEHQAEEESEFLVLSGPGQGEPVTILPKGPNTKGPEQSEVM